MTSTTTSFNPGSSKGFSVSIPKSGFGKGIITRFSNGQISGTESFNLSGTEFEGRRAPESLAFSPNLEVQQKINDLKSRGEAVPASLINKLQFSIPPSQRANLVQQNRSNIENLQAQQSIQNIKVQELKKQQSQLDQERRNLEQVVSDFNQELKRKQGLGYNQGDFLQAEELQSRIDNYNKNADFLESRANALQSNQQVINTQVQSLQEKIPIGGQSTFSINEKGQVYQTSGEPDFAQRNFLQQNKDLVFQKQPSQLAIKTLQEGEIKKSGFIQKTNPIMTGKESAIRLKKSVIDQNFEMFGLDKNQSEQVKKSLTPLAYQTGFALGFVGDVARVPSENITSALTGGGFLLPTGQVVGRNPDFQKRFKINTPEYNYQATFGFPSGTKTKVLFSQGKQTIYPQDFATGLGDIGGLALLETPFAGFNALKQATSKTKIISESPAFTVFTKEKSSGLTTAETFNSTIIEKSDLLGTKRYEIINKLREVEAPVSTGQIQKTKFGERFIKGEKIKNVNFEGVTGTVEKSYTVLESRITEIPKAKNAPFGLQMEEPTLFDKSTFEKLSSGIPEKVFDPSNTGNLSKSALAQVLNKETSTINPFEIRKGLEEKFQKLKPSNERLFENEIINANEQSKDIGAFGGFKSEISFTEESALPTIKSREFEYNPFFNEKYANERFPLISIGEFGESKTSLINEFGLTGSKEIKPEIVSGKKIGGMNLASFDKSKSISGEAVSGKYGFFTKGENGELSTGFFKGEVISSRKGVKEEFTGLKDYGKISTDDSIVGAGSGGSVNQEFKRFSSPKSIFPSQTKRGKIEFDFEEESFKFKEHVPKSAQFSGKGSFDTKVFFKPTLKLNNKIISRNNVGFFGFSRINNRVNLNDSILDRSLSKSSDKSLIKDQSKQISSELAKEITSFKEVSKERMEFNLSPLSKVKIATRDLIKDTELTKLTTVTRPPITVIPRIPGIPKIAKLPVLGGYDSSRKVSRGFDVFVKSSKSSNQFFKINTKALGLGSALGLGKQFIGQESIKQSFRIEPTNELVFDSEKLPDLSEFYTRERKGGLTFIERRKFAISSPSEKQQLNLGKRINIRRGKNGFSIRSKILKKLF